MPQPRSNQLAGLAVLAVLGLTKVGAIDLPAPLKPCHVQDESCLITLAQSYIDTYKKGMLDYNVPSIEPLELGNIRAVNDVAGGSISFNLQLSNTTLHKFGDTIKVGSVKGFGKDLSKPLELSWSLSAPELEVHAKYKVKGKIMILPIVSKGDIVFKLSEVKANSQVSAVAEKRDDGHYYLKISDYQTDLTLKSGRVNMTNLFAENKALHDSTMSMFNQEWTALSAGIQPKILDACNIAFRRVLQKVWDNFPYDAFFDDV